MITWIVSRTPCKKEKREKDAELCGFRKKIITFVTV